MVMFSGYLHENTILAARGCLPSDAQKQESIVSRPESLRLKSTTSWFLICVPVSVDAEITNMEIHVRLRSVDVDTVRFKIFEQPKRDLQHQLIGLSIWIGQKGAVESDFCTAWFWTTSHYPFKKGLLNVRVIY